MALTDHDKKWMETLLVQKLGHLETRFDEKLGHLETRFDEKLGHLETRFDEKLERVETRLLTEFHKWASPVEMRFRSHAAAIRAMDTQVESLTDRVKGLEDQR